MDAGSLGRRGELAAARYLESHGYTVVDRNWRCRLGEIDLVLLDGRTVVFCEVKTRSQRIHGLPEEAVSPVKQRRLVRLARAYLAHAGIVDAAVRFDVVAIDVSCDAAVLRHHVSAFDAAAK
jgi:putative endonuclease